MWNNQKQQKSVFPYVKHTNLLSFSTRFQSNVMGALDLNVSQGKSWINFNPSMDK